MGNAAELILIVEDHPPTRSFLADNLTADGFEVVATGTAQAAAELVDTRGLDLAIVDLGLPDGDGLELVAAIRSKGCGGGRGDPELPVIILSGRTAPLDRLRGFRRGCDDYVTKPFSYSELHARVGALLRRSRSRRAPQAPRIRVSTLEIDVASRRVWVDRQPVSVSGTEFRLLCVLAEEPTRVYTRAELMATVWGFRQGFGKTRTLDAHVARLRRKLGAFGSHYISNVWGVGYRLYDGPLEG
jgi:DNA-binding response OmpR family regulator